MTFYKNVLISGNSYGFSGGDAENLKSRFERMLLKSYLTGCEFF